MLLNGLNERRADKLGAFTQPVSLIKSQIESLTRPFAASVFVNPWPDLVRIRKNRLRKSLIRRERTPDAPP